MLSYLYLINPPKYIIKKKRRMANTYSEPLKSTNLTELRQISLGYCWIRKSNKLTQNKVNPNGTPIYDKFYFGKFYYVKGEEIPCEYYAQNIFKMVLNIKNIFILYWDASDSPHINFIYWIL